ncbi:MAG TPA: hypothetical protein VE959_22510 [Bryobacteraceae bacterium]|nr:hypothetical protein [Bryobacteraceae bacterium]
MPKVVAESDSRIALRGRPSGKAERVVLSERDSLRVLELLENLPAPAGRLMEAAHALPAKP